MLECLFDQSWHRSEVCLASRNGAHIRTPTMDHTFAGIGFEEPNENDVFGDSSMPRGRESEIMVEELDTTLRTLPRGRGVLCNPPAGTVRREEFQSAVWLKRAKQINDRENDKAEAAFHDKKIFGLAKQTQQGLAQIGGKYEMTSIANYIRLGFRDESEFGEDKIDEYKHAVEVTDACKRYDLVKVAELLDVRLPNPKTFGERTRRDPRP